MPLVKVKPITNQIITGSTSHGQILALLLKNRQITPSQTEQFLHPTPPQNLTAADFKISSAKLAKSVKLLKNAISKQQSILLYGDYDADGLTATTLLWQAIYPHNPNVHPFIPDRQLHGYGFKYKVFQQIKQTRPIDLVVTIDNGITAATDINKVSKQGIPVLIVDHHLAPAKLPSSTLAVHSTNTSAAGLAWFLSRQINPSADLGLAALGIVADCLPLVGINRHLVTAGLKSLSTKPCPGLQKLISASAIKLPITTYDLSFILAPRLNAAGRLQDPTDALRLLCSSSTQTATKLAHKLNQANRQRQDLQQQSLKLSSSLYQPSPDRLIFLSHTDFHPGIIGLIAGNLNQTHYLPTIVISQEGDISKGSCRSIPELNIIDTLRQFSSLFIDLGGHAAAAGFSIKTKNIPKLKQKLTDYVNSQLQGLDLSPCLTPDALMELSAVNPSLIKALGQLEPFGLGNPRPSFLFKNLRISSIRAVGSDLSHLKLTLDDPQTPQIETIKADAIAFKQGFWADRLRSGDLIDLVASLDLNTWNNITSPQLIVKQIITN